MRVGSLNHESSHDGVEVLVRTHALAPNLGSTHACNFFGVARNLYLFDGKSCLMVLCEEINSDKADDKAQSLFGV